VYVRVMIKSEIHGIELFTRMVARNDVVTKVLSRRLYPKQLMSNMLNVALCLHNRRKKLEMTLMQMSPHSLPVMKQC
jgi:hypothetical protein